MQNKSLAEQLKAHWARMNSPESLALAKGLRASSGMPKVTIQPTLPNHGRVMVFEEVFDVPEAGNAASDDQPN
ncbi:hypothetical protein [Pseudomonas siliginis]|uniref:hypothetical protein n=1 Tax=Pseudomonas siliginis TaxID=2842346 RepID=UPI0020934080|nr:hypothetical protein [Pseudomonas siliginis]UST77241.1 hypothetical protein NF676_00230 [Pseudomonas siliginis]